MGTVLIPTAGDVSLDPSFAAAICKNLLLELAKTKQFKQVFRGSDRNANDVPGLLITRCWSADDTDVETRTPDLHRVNFEVTLKPFFLPSFSASSDTPADFSVPIRVQPSQRLA